ncbi:hypothetical protein BDZ91DRAFT_784204 [Kalaharituber pfeilii]|nr:hypothetical protein BDZ91DRAFT_784204 [Kalaharituber pfeilii]
MVSNTSSLNAAICLLPNELLRQILSYLGPDSLSSLAQTCTLFATLTLDDTLWKAFVAHLKLSSPTPYSSFRELYISLRPHLYLAPYIWFSTKRFNGSLYVFRYNPKSGSIEGVPLIGVHGSTGHNGVFGNEGEVIWDDLRSMSIATFRRPKIMCVDNDAKVRIVCDSKKYYDKGSGLMMDKATGKEWRTLDGGVSSLGRIRKASPEQQTKPADIKENLQSTIQSHPEGYNAAGFGGHFVAPNVAGFQLEPTIHDDYDRSLWPPPVMPSREHVRIPILSATYMDAEFGEERPARADPHPIFDWEGMSAESLPSSFPRSDNRAIPLQDATDFYEAPPARLDEIFSRDHIFIYKSFEHVAFTTRPSSSGATLEMRTGELYSKVLPALYTRRSTPRHFPKIDLDLSGIWLGDYYTHGPEFLLFHHPNRQNCRLEVLKLTGDVNVPRGEFTFIIPNLTIEDRYRDGTEDTIATPSSFLRFARPVIDPDAWLSKPVFSGRGQLAHQGFRRRTWNEIELVVLDPGDRPEKNLGEVSIIWRTLHHASRARKLDLNKILYPYLYNSESIKQPVEGRDDYDEGVMYLT